MAKKTVAIVLDETDVEIVQGVVNQYDASFSEAIRQIIREWARANREYATTGGQPEKGN